MRQGKTQQSCLHKVTHEPSVGAKKYDLEWLKAVWAKPYLLIITIFLMFNIHKQSGSIIDYILCILLPNCIITIQT